MITNEMLDSLNDREIIIFQKILEGKKVNDIARELFINYHSVASITNRILIKFQTRPKSFEQLILDWNSSIKKMA
jgi:DNA-binding CsgD family transcriptional regulator